MVVQADKFHAASAAMGSAPSTPTMTTPSSTTTLEAAIPPDAPIVFDLLTSEETTQGQDK